MSDNTGKLNTALYVSAALADAKSRVDASLASITATQRIRDLERENEEWRLKWETRFPTPGSVRRRDERITELEREVERVTRMAAADLLTRLDVERMAEADRADAERFRWLVGNYLQINDISKDNWLRYRFCFWWSAERMTTEPQNMNVRALIDADRAKEGE